MDRETAMQIWRDAMRGTLDSTVTGRMIEAFANKVAERAIAEALVSVSHAVAEEREACAKVAEYCNKVDSLQGVCAAIADGIRMRYNVEAREMLEDYRNASCDDAARRVDECMALPGDAARYQWLRHNSGYTIRCNLFGEVGMHEHQDSDLDALIDAQLTPNAIGQGSVACGASPAQTKG